MNKAAFFVAAAIALSGCSDQPEPVQGPPPAPPTAPPAAPVKKPKPESKRKLKAALPAARPPALTAPQNASAKASAPPAAPRAGLQVTDAVLGQGEGIRKGQTALVHYTLTLADGAKLDSSLDRGMPFSFKVGSGDVVAGWDQGVEGMRPGGIRKLVVPPELGYGAGGAGGVVPPNATLYFEIELLEIQ